MPNRTKQLIDLYQQMSNLTASWCSENCTDLESGACCGYGPCEEAYEWAKKKWNVELESTGHPTIPFLGPHGCVVPPHLRPVCTVHVCKRAYDQNPAFAKAYFDLRDRISKLESNLKFGHFVHIS